jgi:hypothetical protein
VPVHKYEVLSDGYDRGVKRGQIRGSELVNLVVAIIHSHAPVLEKAQDKLRGVLGLDAERAHLRRKGRLKLVSLFRELLDDEAIPYNKLLNTANWSDFLNAIRRRE